ncbi:MAG: Cu(I)-responsive transcriptional regulator [Gammaproteobacteria bacterium]
MNIGVAARASGLSTKTVRYYAEIGLVAPATRHSNGYREYADTEIRKLRFVRKARAFGFSVDECRELLDLYEDRERASADVKRIALEKIEALDAKLHELRTLRNELSTLAETCSGDERPDCPILDNLAHTT